MKRREARSPASDEQLALPFDRSPKATRSNGAEPLAVRIPDAVRMTGIGRSKLYELIASGDLETIKIGSDGRCSQSPSGQSTGQQLQGRSLSIETLRAAI